MSVVTPDDLRRGRQGQTPATGALLEQMTGQAPAAQTQPVASSPGQSFSAFQRGGQVKQLPGMDTKGLAEAAGGAGLEGARALAGTGGQAAKTGMSATSFGSGAAGAATSAGIGLATGYLADKMRVKEDMPTFGGEFGDLTDQYGRRFEGTGGGIGSNAVRYAGYGAAGGPIGMGVGALAGAIVGAATKNAPSAYTDFSVEDAADAIGKAYQKYLGRPASEEEIRNQLIGQGWDPNGGDRWVGEKGLRGDAGVLAQIRDSDEAKQFAATGLNANQRAEQAAQAANPLGTPAAVAAPGAAAGGVTGGGGRLEGFDAGKLADASHTSPKYQVARVLQKYPSTPEGLQQALAEINALGLGTASISGSKGDKLTFSGNVDPRFNGITTFDVIRGAGNGGEAWQWNPEGGDTGAQPTTNALLSAMGSPGAATAGPTDSSALPGVMQAIQALLARQGQSSATSYTDALLRDLNATA
ncbi:MAG TPA: hypothetical protein VFY71_07420 [Planctomycetota bacterium]|nr:hypothetical protein [Planctomycetota bacterium]